VRYTFANMNIMAGDRVRFQFASDQSLLVYFDHRLRKTGLKTGHYEVQLPFKPMKKSGSCCGCWSWSRWREFATFIRHIVHYWSSSMGCGCGTRKWKRFCGDISRGLTK